MANYVKTTWTDYTPPAIMAARLNYIEAGIENAQGDFSNLYGLTANRPASVPTAVGRFYTETDLLLRIWRDNGAGWDLISAPMSTVLRAETADYTITDTDGVVVVDATTGNILITLPIAVGRRGKIFTVKRIDGSGNTVTVQGAETIDDAANQLLNQYDALMVVSDDTEWWIL